MPPKKRKSPFAGFKSILITYFNFTINERKGIFVLIILQALLMCVFIYFKYTTPYNSNINYNRLDSTVVAYNAMYIAPARNIAEFNPGANFKDTTNKPVYEQNNENNETAFTKHATKKLFMFNPNNLPDSAWTALGLSEKQIRVINNYQNKGGKFYSKADVKKMYCISDKQFATLEPYINLPDAKPAFIKDSLPKPFNKPPEPKATIKIEPVELNIANEEDLITIPGIGPARASSIIKYREKLGGYMELEQVKEAYGMDTIFDRIKKYLQLELYTTRFININTTNTIELKHPYLAPSIVSIIINYRKQHGNFSKVDELKNLNILDEATYKKLEPYLRVK